LLEEELYRTCGEVPVEISFWLYVDHRTDNMPSPELWLLDGDGQLIRKEKIDSRSVHNVDGMWARISHVLVPEAGIRYRLNLRGKYITADDLLVAPAGARVLIRNRTGPVLLDNFRFPVAAVE
jgi:hypothetical protein